MLEDNLGVTIDYATMDFQTYQARLATDPPRIWSISWVADYPGPNDFLGVLLGTGSTANQGGWSNPDFDAAITDATSAADPATATAAYARAMGIVRDQAPAIPVSYGTSFSLVRDGLLGRQPERPRHPAPRGPHVGARADDGPRCGRCGSCPASRSSRGLLVVAPSAVASRPTSRSARPTRPRLRRVDHVHDRRHAVRAARPGRAPAPLPGLARSGHRRRAGRRRARAPTSSSTSST